MRFMAANIISRRFITGMLDTALEWWNKFVTWSLELMTEDITLVWGGGLWTVISTVYNSLLPVGLALCVMTFLIGLFYTTSELIMQKRFESLVFAIIRYILSYSALIHGLEIIKTIVMIAQGCVGYVLTGAGGMDIGVMYTMPDSVREAILDCTRLEQIGYFVLSLLVFLCVIIFGFQLILVVVGRFNRLGVTAGLLSIGFSWFAGNITKDMGRSHLKTYVAICLEGLVLVVSLLISSVLVNNFGVTFDESEYTSTVSNEKVYSVSWDSSVNEIYVTVANNYTIGGYTAAYYDYPTNKYSAYITETSVDDNKKVSIGNGKYFSDNVGDTYTFAFEGRSTNAVSDVVEEFLEFETARSAQSSVSITGEDNTSLTYVLEWMLILAFNVILFVSMVRGMDNFAMNLIRGG